MLFAGLGSVRITGNFQDLVAKVKNLVALAPVLEAILRPASCNFF